RSHSGAPRSGKPGIHTPRLWLWIPGSVATLGPRNDNRESDGHERTGDMLIDSHCHLDFPDFAGELDAVVARAQAAGIARIITISTRVRRHAELLAIAERFPSVYCSVGTHPHNAHEELDITV